VCARVLARLLFFKSQPTLDFMKSTLQDGVLCEFNSLLFYTCFDTSLCILRKPATNHPDLRPDLMACGLWEGQSCKIKIGPNPPNSLKTCKFFVGLRLFYHIFKLVFLSFKLGQ
jgi:hypothetical protein